MGADAVAGKEKQGSRPNDIPLADQRKAAYSRLFRKFIIFTAVCSLIPLLLVGWAVNFHYTRFARARLQNSFQTQVDYHRKIIDLFLKEHSSKLHLIANTHTLDQLVAGAALHSVFDLMNQEKWSVTDIGVIDENGDHLAYVGPYDLLDRNYAQTFWFKQVMDKGLYISDMFMGYRKEPHFVIAVLRTEGERKWILRATIDTEYFRSLVENVRIGQTGEVYLVNRDGVYQTSPRFGGRIMDRAPFPIGPPHGGIEFRVLEATEDGQGLKSPRQIVCQTWLDNPGWMLVVKQNYSEAFSDVNHANFQVLLFIHLTALTILVVTVFITRHMISMIKARDKQTDRLNEQLLQAGKMAAIGELSAGVAHEINNPLAIVLTERQILLDYYSHMESLNDDAFKSQFVDSMTQIDVQVQRCKRITQNLLRFARRTESVIEKVDINGFIREMVELMEREAKANGIKFTTQLESGLPSVASDPSQLQQVFLNLITNAIDAHDEKPYGAIHITTESNGQGDGVYVTFADTGCGIKSEHVPKIFDPFFTTKTVGKGTGLGLSICYSIMKRLGGTISVTSQPGSGTEFVLFVPFIPPPDLVDSMGGDGAQRTYP